MLGDADAAGCFLEISAAIKMLGPVIVNLLLRHGKQSS
jgi:hypothetical protein